MPSYAWRCVCEQPDNALKGHGVEAYALDYPPSKQDGAAQPVGAGHALALKSFNQLRELAQRQPMHHSRATLFDLR